MNPRDRIAALKEEVDLCSKILERDGLMSQGSRGQPIAHPLIAARHTAISILQKLEAQMPEESGPNPLDLFLNESIPGIDMRALGV